MRPSSSLFAEHMDVSSKPGAVGAAAGAGEGTATPPGGAAGALAEARTRGESGTEDFDAALGCGLRRSSSWRAFHGITAPTNTAGIG